ncbi:MAG: hypothetical protein RBG13Loki_4079 [Promethearchaeota archaeon CR_4]|nr:MAG: hypothetical protein RBG13Loki_4079 [Candidatus Lokiarchaeota archaeon CR_4]
MTGLGNGGFLPAILSYTNDTLDLHTRSRFFGVFNASAQFANICGLILTATLFEAGLWQLSYWIIGGIVHLAAILIAITISEPKRGIKHVELRDVLADVNTHYTYNLTRETVKSTFFKPTNVVAFLEGLFTCTLLTSTNFLLLPYLQAYPTTSV